jgi:Tfp pilus assembly protein FimT
VETLIVVMIVAIVAAMAMPMFATTHTTRLRGAAQTLVADLAFAQIESISHSDDPRLVIFDTDAHSYRIVAASDPATPINNPVGNQPYQVVFGEGRAAMYQGVTIANLSIDAGDRVQFGAYGELDQATPATITLACQGATLTISIDPILGEATIGEIE